MAVLRRSGEDSDEVAAEVAVRHYQHHQLVDPATVEPGCWLCADDLRVKAQLAGRRL